jgi:hypothetical protein
LKELNQHFLRIAEGRGIFHFVGFSARIYPEWNKMSGMSGMSGNVCPR